MKTSFLLLVLLPMVAGMCKAAPNTSQAERYAWNLSGKGTKPVECYFWVTKTEVSAVACAVLKHPSDEIAVILPVNATDFYHTHPSNFPALSEADKAAERKSGIRIHVIH